MTWKIEFFCAAEKDFAKLDRGVQKRIVEYLKKRVLADPFRLGDDLSGILPGLRRYRVICQIKNDLLTVLVVSIGHRREVYRDDHAQKLKDKASQ